MRFPATDPEPRYPTRAVVDTNVIVNVALGKKDTTDPTFLPRSKQLLNDGIAGKLELLLPAIVLMELSSDSIVRSGATGQTRNQERQCKRKLKEWCRNSALPMVDLTADAAGWFSETPEVQGLRLGDAAILASARYAHASHIYTWDRTFITTVERARQQQKIDIIACNPPRLPARQGELEYSK